MEAVIVWGHNMSRGPYRMPTAKVDNKKKSNIYQAAKNRDGAHTHTRTHRWRNHAAAANKKNQPKKAKQTKKGCFNVHRLIYKREIDLGQSYEMTKKKERKISGATWMVPPSKPTMAASFPFLFSDWIFPFSFHSSFFIGYQLWYHQSQSVRVN